MSGFSATFQTAGTYTIQYTSSANNDPNPNFSTGCSVVITQNIEIIQKPGIPSLSDHHLGFCIGS